MSSADPFIDLRPSVPGHPVRRRVEEVCAAGASDGRPWAPHTEMLEMLSCAFAADTDGSGLSDATLYLLAEVWDRVDHLGMVNAWGCRTAALLAWCDVPTPAVCATGAGAGRMWLWRAAQDLCRLDARLRSHLDRVEFDEVGLLVDPPSEQLVAQILDGIGRASARVISEAARMAPAAVRSELVAA